LSLNNVNLIHTPQLINLKVGDEKPEDVMRVPPEDMLLRWFNHHLKNAGHDHHITNYDKDVKDSVKYTHLLNQLNPDCDKAALDEEDVNKRGESVLNNSTKLNVPPVIVAEDISSVIILN